MPESAPTHLLPPGRLALKEGMLRAPSQRAALFVAAWMGFAGLFALQSISSYAGQPPIPVLRILAYHGLEASFWALASLCLHVAAGRLRQGKGWRRVALPAAAVLGATAASGAWMAVVAWAVGPRFAPLPDGHALWQSVQASFAYGALLAVMLMAACTAIHLAQEARQRALEQARAEAALVRERLEMLTLHLQPHFLFNTLNMIVGLVPGEPQRAVDIVHKLSALLRAAIDTAGSTQVPIEQELALAEQYLSIARARYGERLTIDVEIGAGLQGAFVPSMLMQPLLENAIQHTAERRSGPGAIRLLVLRTELGVEFLVEDDGAGLLSDSPIGTARGMGLANTRQRLAMIYGDRASLSLATRPEGGARAVVRIPCLPSKAGVASSAHGPHVHAARVQAD